MPEERREGDIIIQFGTETFRGNYLDALKIDDRNLNEALMTQPSSYVWWSLVTFKARMLWEQAKLELERHDSQMYTFVRSDKESRGEKVTEKAIETQVTLDPGHQERHTAVLRTRLQYDHLDSVRTAFEMRSQMLMSLSANMRVEWEANPSVREGAAAGATARVLSRVGQNVRTDARATAALNEI